MKKYNENKKLIAGLVIACMGILACLKANGFLGYVGGAFIILGGMIVSIKGCITRKNR